MKQVLQDLRTGDTVVTDVPCPAVSAGHVLIRTRCSLLSAGTERMLVEFGKAGLLEKARQQPDKVRLVIDKIRTDGLFQTIAAVRNKFHEQLPMGYCNVGTVVTVGAAVTDFAPGDRVVSNGKHAEYVTAPVNLCAKVPDGVTDDDAVFAVIAAIALQGIRLAQPTLGEAVAVIGLGLVGLITVQLLRAQGCRVLGIDREPGRVELAREFGAQGVEAAAGDDPVTAAAAFSRGAGIDAVIITASTASSEPVHQAALMCRKRGRIVLVGVTGLNLSRADFYQKELTFQVSCSYGPGRYDSEYEEKGRDYPIGYVRWTEQRNFAAVVDLLAERRLDFRRLISHRFPFARAADAYRLLTGPEPYLGIVLAYEASDHAPSLEERRASRTIEVAPATAVRATGPVIGIIGAGAYSSVLIPALNKAGARLKTIASQGGVSAARAAHRFGGEYATTDVSVIFDDPEIDTVVICTRHDSHARLACDALQAGKHVFMEKPLALSSVELDDVRATYERVSKANPPPLLMVGFNRRFAPHATTIRSLLARVGEPKAFVLTVNAGALSADHWTQDVEVGGGRIVGEACHFIDLLRFLAGAPITRVLAMRMDDRTGRGRDTASVQLAFGDGSYATIHYLANGHRSFPKERLEVFASGRVLQLDNFRRLRGFGWPGFRTRRLWRQDKGQNACAAAFVAAVRRGTASPIPFDELVEISRAAIDAAAISR